MPNFIKDLEVYIQEVHSPYVTPQCYHGHIAVHTWTATEAATASTDGVHAAITLTTAVQTITADITDPPCARNTSITVSLAGGSLSGNVIIAGTNIFGEAITETVAVTTATTYVGTVAFKTVTSIKVPARTTSGDIIAIGFGDKLGLSFYLNHKDQLIQCSLNDVIESTRGTIVADSDEIEKNTLDLSSPLNGTVVDAYVIIY